jgi:uncharacterized protein YndB with AHSA1/START domain
VLRFGAVTDGRCELRLTRRYAASPGEVWRALTEPDSVARWLAPPSGVELRAVEPERVLELAWHPDGEEPSVVRLELRAEGDGTTLVLDHRQIVATRGMRYLHIWMARLDAFEEALS